MSTTAVLRRRPGKLPSVVNSGPASGGQSTMAAKKVMLPLDGPLPSDAETDAEVAQLLAPNHAANPPQDATASEAQQQALHRQTVDMRAVLEVPGDVVSLKSIKAAVLSGVEWFRQRRVVANYVVLTLLSVCTRFYRIAHPSHVVFDEYHFGSFVNHYQTGHYFFDIHPPLGKLTLAFFGYIMGYDATKCAYNRIDDPFDDACGYAKLRFVAAMFGSFQPMLIHAIALHLGASANGALLAGSLVVFDMLSVTEARLVLTDSQLLFYIALSLYIALSYWSRVAAVEKQRKKLAKRENNIWLVSLGLACGAAVSVKWTALATPGLIAVESLSGVFGFVHKRRPLADAAKVVATMAVVYFTCFWWHFYLLPLSGDGDAFMSYEFQQTLIGNQHYKATAPSLDFFGLTVDLNREMLAANARILTPHAWSSKWYQWLVNSRGVLYWGRAFDDQHWMSIYLLGNPLILWGCLAGVFSFSYVAYQTLRSKSNSNAIRKAQPFYKKLSFCLAAYSLNLLPYVAVARSAFIYHYLPGLMYAQLLSAVFLDYYAGRHSALACAAAMAVSVLTFWFFSPWVYGLPLTSEEHAARRWLSSWD